MNATVFEKWFIDMLGNLEEPCIIVMDNASYHSMLAEGYSKSNTRKAESDAKMDVLTLYNILEDEADEELLLIANCLREEDNEIFTERSREGCFNILVERRLIDNETRFRAYFRAMKRFLVPFSQSDQSNIESVTSKKNVNLLLQYASLIAMFKTIFLILVKTLKTGQIKPTLEKEKLT
ncbi:hypothetical protein QTP88_003002 [Uroleucon formosanum]